MEQEKSNKIPIIVTVRKCTKHIYLNKTQAISYAEKLKRTGKSENDLYPYLCSKCFNWHLSKSNSEKDKNYTFEEYNKLKEKISSLEKKLQEKTIECYAHIREINRMKLEQGKIE